MNFPKCHRCAVDGCLANPPCKEACWWLPNAAPQVPAKATSGGGVAANTPMTNPAAAAPASV